MLDFYKTRSGRSFFDGQVPRLVEALETIATSMVRAQKTTGNIAEDGKWKKLEEGRYIHEPSLVLFGCEFHVEAIEVRTGADGVQSPRDQDNVFKFEDLYTLTGTDKPLDTVEINGFPCVVFITPYAQ